MPSLLAAHQSRGLHLVTDGGLTAHLGSPDRAVLSAYRELTYSGATAGLSLYFVDRWLEVVHPYRVALWARLQSLARVKGTPQPSLADLAGSLRGLTEEAVRKHFIRWWQTPQPGDPEWEFFRAAVQIEERPGRPYRFVAVVLDDLLHPDDLPTLEARVGHYRAGSQGRLILPSAPLSEIPRGPEPGPASLPDASESQTAAAPPPAQTQTGAAPPTPPMCCALPLALPGKLRGESPGVDPDEPAYPSEAEVPALLAELGVTKRGIRQLLAHASGEGPLWAARWCVWAKAKKSLSDPAAFVFSRILGACNGDEACREAPWEWERDQAERRRARKEAERTAAVVATRPDPFLARKSAPRPDPATAVLPELAPVWERLRAEKALPVRAALAAATAVTREGSALVLELPGISAEALRSRREQLLEAARTVCPELTELRFATTKGGR